MTLGERCVSVALCQFIRYMQLLFTLSSLPKQGLANVCNLIFRFKEAPGFVVYKEMLCLHILHVDLWLIASSDVCIDSEWLQ